MLVLLSLDYVRKGEENVLAFLSFSVASFVKRVIIDSRIKGGIYERDSRIITDKLFANYEATEKLKKARTFSSPFLT